MISFPTLWSNTLKIQAFGEELQNLSSWKGEKKATAKREEEWSFVNFSHDYKWLKVSLKTWSCSIIAFGSNRIKLQDKILALGSIRVYPPKIFLTTSYNETHAQFSRIATNETRKNRKPTERTSIVFPFQNLSPNLFPRLQFSFTP